MRNVSVQYLTEEQIVDRLKTDPYWAPEVVIDRNYPIWWSLRQHLGPDKGNAKFWQLVEQKAKKDE